MFNSFDSFFIVRTIELIKLAINRRPRGRSLEESMIFLTYNRFRISDSSKDFSESYEKSACFNKILEIVSESLKTAFISKIQKNHRESFRIVKNHSESLRFRARLSESARVSLRSLEINALKLV